MGNGDLLGAVLFLQAVWRGTRGTLVAVGDEIVELEAAGALAMRPRRASGYSALSMKDFLSQNQGGAGVRQGVLATTQSRRVIPEVIQ